MLCVRPAALADVPAIARVDVETWRTSYAGILPDHLLVGLSERQRSGLWTRFIERRPGDTVVAIDRDPAPTRLPGPGRSAVVGFGSCGAQRDPDLPFAGEVFTLYVTPDVQGQGAGRQLLLAMFQRLIRCGLYSAAIWVLAENPARFFYERVGGKLYARRPIRVSDATVDALCYGWPSISQALQSQARATSRPD